MIYLDNNATTALDPAALEAMLPFLQASYGNPSSGYAFSRSVRKAVNQAREQVAALLGSDTDEIVFTSGGTEGDNAALFSATEAYPERKHLVTVAAEHDAVLNYCRWLVEARGYEVTRLCVQRDGRLDLQALAAAIRPNETAVVSVMWANNETGVISPIAEAAQLAADRGVLFHTDAVQAVGKIPLNVHRHDVHSLALSGHKLHAPKGVGALYVNKRVRFRPWMLGGGQEQGRRSGTENVAGIVALGAASEAARHHLEKHGTVHDPIRMLRDEFEQELQRRVSGVTINGHLHHRTPNTSNVRISGADAQGILILLDQRGICCSAGSACNTGALHPSHVLAAMGLPPEEARECLRISFSRFNTREELKTLLSALEHAAVKMRTLTATH